MKLLENLHLRFGESSNWMQAMIYRTILRVYRPEYKKNSSQIQSNILKLL